MNKIYKCALGLLTAFALSFASFSNAEYVSSLVSNIQQGNVTVKSSSQGNTLLYNLDGDYGIYCLEAISISDNSISNFQFGITYDISVLNSDISVYLWKDDLPSTVCLPYHLDYFVIHNLYNTPFTLNYRLYRLDTLLNTEIPVYSSLQCQTEYNLIPINEVTPNYCALNFGMIDPQQCPINEGTGEIVRSNLMINDVPYAQNQNINIFIPDFLAWNIGFNDLYTVIEVEGYNADEEYIENVINQEKLTPTNKDIEEMITGFMTNYFPYLALTIVFLYLARKIFKLFK